jgi:hypothetical protein
MLMSYYKHRKRGSYYELLGHAKMQIGEETLSGHVTTQADTLSLVAVLERKLFVVYRAVKDDSLWVRPETEFFDGRFEAVREDAVTAR